jgi:hypothetical protein
MFTQGLFDVEGKKFLIKEFSFPWRSIKKATISATFEAVFLAFNVDLSRRLI